MNFEVGDVVISLKGRDKHRIYAVYKIVNDNFILLVNGAKRCLSNPKQKRIKHVLKTTYKLDMVFNEAYTDAKLRKELLRLLSEEEIKEVASDVKI